MTPRQCTSGLGSEGTKKPQLRGEREIYKGRECKAHTQLHVVPEQKPRIAIHHPIYRLFQPTKLGLAFAMC